MVNKFKTWGMTNLPSFRGRKVHILPGPGHGQVAALFCEMQAKRSPDIESADLVVFLGGADVSPYLYGQKPVDEVTYCDQQRDKRERDVFELCRNKKIPMFGICRGAQFLHVMNEGTLWQHVDNHTQQHLIYDVEEDLTVMSSSTHHQMMEYNETMVLLACTNDPVATILKNDETTIQVDSGVIEVEACFYETSQCLCIQGHPEYGPPEFASWSFHKLHELLNCGFETSPSSVLTSIA